MTKETSKKLILMRDNMLSFWCPGCDESHSIRYGAGGWAWNCNAESPTITPSVRVRSGHHAGHYKKGDQCWCTYNKEFPPEPGQRVFACQCCHSFITDGRIQFLGDCTHAMAGQTVCLPDFPEKDGTGEQK